MLASFTAESPLTGLGAGGYMLVHPPGGEDDVLLDFFVEVPGRGGVERGAELVASEVYFTDDQQPQVFHIGAASCGVPGTPAGLERALELFGSVPLSELVGAGVSAARDGVELTEQQAYFIRILEPILCHTEEGRAIYAPEGRLLREGEAFRIPELADALELYAAEGSEPFYTGEFARAIAVLGDRSRRHAHLRGPGGVRDDRRASRSAAASTGARCSRTRRRPRAAY